MCFSDTSATGVVGRRGCINTSVALPTAGSGNNIGVVKSASYDPGTDPVAAVFSIGPWRVVPAITTTYHLLGQIDTLSGGSSKGYGFISATRIPT